MAKFTATNKFDDRLIQDEELRSQLKSFLDSYNFLVQDLTQVLNNITFQDNIKSQTKELTINHNQESIISSRALGAVIIESTNTLTSYRITNNSLGLSILATTEDNNSSTIKVLILQ